MPTLSKDAELELLKDAFGKSTGLPDLEPFLEKVSEFLDCRAYAAEYLNNGSATGRFTGQPHAEAFSGFLSGHAYHQGVSAFMFLLGLAQSGTVYRIYQGHLSKLDEPVKTSTDENSGPPQSALISIIRNNSSSTLIFGLLFDGAVTEEAASAETVLAFSKVTKILETCFGAIANMDALRQESRIRLAFAKQSTVPAVLVNKQRTVIAEHENGLSALAELDLGLTTGGKLKIRNRELELLLSEILTEPGSAQFQKRTSPRHDGTSDETLSRLGLCVHDPMGNLNRITIEAVSGEAHDPWALVRVCRPAKIPEAVEIILQEELGLSQSEAHLAWSLAVTGSVSATTELLNITRNTMKTHLRRIFDKTAVRTQLELVQLVYRLSGLV